MTNTIQAICNPGGKSGKIDLQEPKSLCWGLLEFLHHRIDSDRTYVEKIGSSVMSDEPVMLYISDLAKWCSLARTHVNRDRGSDLAYRPRAELGLRLASQLVKLAISLCITLQIEKPTQQVLDIIRKVALDTSISFPLEIMLCLAHHPDKQGMTKEQLCSVTNLSSTSMTRWLTDLMEINIVTCGRGSGASLSRGRVTFLRGRPNNFYTLTPEVQELAESCGFSSGSGE